MAKSKHKLLKVFIYIVAAFAVIAIVIGYYIRATVFKPLELTETVYIYIEPSTKYDEVAAQIKKKVDLPSDKVFELIAERMNYPQSLKTGRYAIKDGMTMPEIIRMLRSGNQTAVKLTFNNMRTKENLAGRISNQLMVDSLALLTALKDEKKVEELGFDTNTVVAMFIPNTYEVYWDTSVDKLLTRMHNEYNTFWNESRKAKAEQIGLTPLEVSTLASIVEEEATYSDEYSTVAGLYLNRLKRGQRLEADPTVKFAVGDFSLRRILYKHLEVESPYNTYRNDGLPPGPIRVPSIKGIDA
ncbi:MAG: endolytic transglycosylase MltG, partial [Dysgonamonadaceae bacterium]|nr:endolytic transglycosylase MltG [Dysgonamonadaceae bacterium]